MKLQNKKKVLTVRSSTPYKSYWIYWWLNLTGGTSTAVFGIDADVFFFLDHVFQFLGKLDLEAGGAVIVRFQGFLFSFNVEYLLSLASIVTCYLLFAAAIAL